MAAMGLLIEDFQKVPMAKKIINAENYLSSPTAKGIGNSLGIVKEGIIQDTC